MNSEINLKKRYDKRLSSTKLSFLSSHNLFKKLIMDWILMKINAKSMELSFSLKFVDWHNFTIKSKYYLIY